MLTFSYLANAHPDFIENLYKDYKIDPQSVDAEWEKFFSGFDFATEHMNGSSESGDAISPLEFQVYALIEAYRKKAHLISDTNPIRERKDRGADLELVHFGLTEAHLDQKFRAGEFIGLPNASLKDIIARLQKIYCGSIGIETYYIHDKEQLDFLNNKFENEWPKLQFSSDKKRRILEKLNGAVGFEQFLHTKYIGQKRFSLEGGETTIPALDAFINKGAELGVQECVIGMAHRGRLNVLVNTIGKTYEEVFNEFEGNAAPDQTMGDGDVKYHLGFSSQVDTPSGKKVNLKLSPNPSHLEAVNPVVEGFVRAQADNLYNSDLNKIVPILVHGDAAIAGQGVVYEVVQMSQLPGYYSGGTIHFTINNQIGFTTDFDDARSSSYCTSVAKIVKAPVFHVNGDDAEAVVFACEVAMEYRQKFNADVFVDMVCYRKHGHNEGDDPKFTQPHLYKLIGKQPNPREIYTKKLISQGDVDAALANSMEKSFWANLQDRLDDVREKALPYQLQKPEMAWNALRQSTPEDFKKSPVTAITSEDVDMIVSRLMEHPTEIKPIKKIEKMLQKRREAYAKDKMLDWASAELLAYGSLLKEGHNIRMTGQDVKRGTFSHRHSCLYDAETNQEYNRLDNLFPEMGTRFHIYNSFLSEFAVLGYEFGYSWGSPEALTIWEAQFGDFANGAQTMIDQFITSCESKWNKMSGLTMLLPHGYEGQGPEHSSARLERFLQSCAEFNIQVMNITSPANFFHAMRRQLKRPFRKPLVIMSPKSLLRHPDCVSHIEKFTSGGVRETLIDNYNGGKKTGIKKVVFCSGKIYFDIDARIKAENKKDIVVVRVEQLYPLPFGQIDEVMKQYPDAEKVWAQDEPANMGAWVYILSCYKKVNWTLASRKSSASPATGFAKVHEQEQQAILDQIMS